jgi:hypothetical protein
VGVGTVPATCDSLPSTVLPTLTQVPNCRVPNPGDEQVVPTNLHAGDCFVEDVGPNSAH